MMEITDEAAVAAVKGRPQPSVAQASTAENTKRRGRIAERIMGIASLTG